MKNKLGLYVHIPFCIRKCNYCDFLSFPADEETKRAYADALIREIRARGRTYGDRTVDTLYIGGGTPSVMPEASLSALMDALRSSFSIEDNAEISMEMNPGTGNAALYEFLALQVNRVSLGAQSMDDRMLRRLGRIHSREDTLQTVRSLREKGIRNINIDLMSALPGQTIKSWEKTLKEALHLAPEHLSIYSLMIEPGTPFAREASEGTLPFPDEAQEEAMDALTKEYLAKAGYLHYEISNYAKEGYACRHNLRYWRTQDYLGLGLGASSCADGARWKNTGDLSSYLAKSPAEAQIIKEKEALTIQRQMEEFMFLGLRLTEGVSAAEFFSRFGVSLFAIYGAVCDKLKKQKLLTEKDGRFALTERGLAVSNRTLSAFLLS